MVEYVFISLFVGVIGLAALVVFLRVLLHRAELYKARQRERGQLSQGDLDKYIRELNQAATDAEVDHLVEKREND